MSAVGYLDGRCHFVFTDQTSLILHPKGDCFTYFRKDGKKLRQLVKFAMSKTVSDKEVGTGPLPKLLLALQLYNTYYDEPIVSREELYQSQEVIEKQAKITKVTWPGLDNLDEYTWIDEHGHLHLRSIEDELCEIVLSSNCLHIRVNFLYLLPNKKAKWTQVENQMNI